MDRNQAKAQLIKLLQGSAQPNVLSEHLVTGKQPSLPVSITKQT